MRLLWAEVGWERRRMLETLELELYFRRTWMLKMKKILAEVGEGCTLETAMVLASASHCLRFWYLRTTSLGEGEGRKMI